MDFLNKTFKTINSSGDLEIIDAPKIIKDMSRSVTDKTNYISDSEAIKRLTLQGSQPLTNPQLRAFYDFADGKDTGMKLPVTRLKGVDIAEVSTEIKKETENIKEALEKERKKKALYESLKDTTTTTATTTTETASKNTTPSE